MTRNQTLLLGAAFIGALFCDHMFSAGATPVVATAIGAPAPIRQITVSGRGSIKVVPNVVRVHLGVTNSDLDLKAAVARTDATAAKLSALKAKYKLSENDVQTEHLAVNPRFTEAWDYQLHSYRHQIENYSASKGFVFILHHPADLQAFLSDAVAAGANKLGEDYESAVKFEAEDNNEGDRKSHEAAVKAARQKAEEMASALGCRVGPPISVEEEQYSYYAPHLAGATNGTLGPRGTSASSNEAGGIDVGRVSYECSVKIAFQLL